jgi:hypothetical protein
MSLNWSLLIPAQEGLVVKTDVITAVLVDTFAANIEDILVASYKSLFIRNCSIIFGARQKMVGSSFRLIISFTTNCVTVEIKVLKLCFTSGFKISQGADLEHFRKVFPPPVSPLQLNTIVRGPLAQLQDTYYVTRTCP